ncbi:MAG TPA: PEP-CTERM sorting domain-containing protein [Terriglobia bacterium]|nr:PEP-CTERM sorting domain-containing protein [Terriglobia bacterium]
MKSRKTTDLGERLNKRWRGYAAAAGAACVGMLAGATTAKADIVYVVSGWGFDFFPTNPPGSYPWQTIASVNLNVLGVNGFQVSASGFLNPYYGRAKANVAGFGNIAFLNSGRPLAKGTEIGAGGPGVGGGIPLGAFYLWRGFASVEPQWMSATSTTGYHYRAFGHLNNGYLGLRFDLNGQYYYGWAEFSFQEAAGGGVDVSGDLTGYAYNTVPGQSIQAGQTTAATPEPATLALLALGSLGLGFWRRRKQEPEGSSRKPEDRA